MKGFVQTLSDIMLDKMDVVITFSKKEDGIYLIITPKNPKLDGLDLAGLTINGPATEFDTILEERLGTMPSFTIKAIERITEWEEALGKNVTKKVEGKKDDKTTPKKNDKKPAENKVKIPDSTMFEEPEEPKGEPFVPNAAREDDNSDMDSGQLVDEHDEVEAVNMSGNGEGTDEEVDPPTIDPDIPLDELEDDPITFPASALNVEAAPKEVIPVVEPELIPEEPEVTPPSLDLF